MGVAVPARGLEQQVVALPPDLLLHRAVELVLDGHELEVDQPGREPEFARLGGPAVEAAIAAGAHYLDSTGEGGFIRAVGRVATDLGLDEPGYRLLSNMGKDGGQEVPHFHVHLFGGGPLGPMISRRN